MYSTQSKFMSLFKSHSRFNATRLRIARKMIGVFLFLAVSWLPFCVLGLYGPTMAGPKVVAMTGYLVMFNSVANTVVYGWNDRVMRGALRDALWRCCHRLFGGGGGGLRNDS
ncbi:hypothetical protein ACOMHN_037495 [Nucella lapillus]